MPRRRYLHWLGSGLVLLSLGLLTKGLMSSGKDVIELISDVRVLALTIGLSVVYSALLGLPALAWASVLAQRSARSGAALTAVRIYARCNILKYLPGNVFHFGGRQVLASRAGWAHEDILLASVFETAALPLTAVWVALVLLGLGAMLDGGVGHAFGHVLINGVEPSHLVLGAAAAAGVVAAACILAFRRGVNPISLTVMALLNTSFFVANAVLVLGLALVMHPASLPELCVLAAAYLASWSIGFLTPGAPGGIGIREVAFVQLAAAVVPASEALAIALLARLVTSLGDLWFGLICLTSMGSGARAELGSGGK